MSITCRNVMRLPVNPRTTVLVGVGNRLRRDDAAGPRLVEMLAGWSGLCVDAGGAPADRAEELLALPELRQVIVVDCAELGLEPGAFRRVEPDQIESGTLSSHRIPIHLFVELMRQLGGCEVCIVGIQPLDVTLGEGLSPAVTAGLTRLAAMIRHGELILEE